MEAFAWLCHVPGSEAECERDEDRPLFLAILRSILPDISHD